jgi:hypothetical protein
MDTGVRRGDGFWLQFDISARHFPCCAAQTMPDSL